MTKDELELEVKRLEKIVKDQEHLSESVRAKDTEINDNEKRHQALLAETIHAKDTKYEQLTEKYNQLLLNIEVKVASKVAEIQGMHKTDTDKLIQEKENIIKMLEIHVEHLNECLTMHGDLLKTLESVTNTHLTLNRKFIEGLK